MPRVQTTQSLWPQEPTEALASGKLMARALTAKLKPAAALNLARSFCAQLVSSWWSEILKLNRSHVAIREYLAPFEMGRLPSSAAALADSLAVTISALPIDSASHYIGQTYTGMLPPEYRADFGVFYTPPGLTERLLDLAEKGGVDWRTAKILDPACGGGAFLAPVARRIRAALGNASPAIVLRNVAARLRGYEIDPFAAWLSQVALDATMLPECRNGHRLPVLVSVRDSLKCEDASHGFDLVIGNPPYGRVTLDVESRQLFKRGLFGHANLYGLFTDLAIRHTALGGLIAFVTPTSMLGGEYFKSLRSLLAEEAPPTSMDFISARKGVFDDVLQETLLATYRYGGTKAAVRIHEVVPISEDSVRTASLGFAHLPMDASQPWILPRRSEQAELIERLGEMPCRLADWGYAVSTGPLVWNRKKDQLEKNGGKNRLPLIWAESITNDGKFIWRADKKNHAPYFAVTAKDAWLVSRQSCVLLQRTTAKEQSRRLIATALPEELISEFGGVVIENHLNMIRPINASPAVTPAALAAFLNSSAADRVFRCISGSVAVSAYELEALPLPSPAAMASLSGLVKRGGNPAEIERFCNAAYSAEFDQ